MKNFFYYFLIFLFSFQYSFVNAEDFESDLSLSDSDVFFSTIDPIIDTKLRIYAEVKNNSAKDLV